MIERKSQSTVKPNHVRIMGNKVLVADNIVEKLIENEMNDSTLMYFYDEKVYKKDEYIELISKENDTLRSEVDQLILDSLM